MALYASNLDMFFSISCGTVLSIAGMLFILADPCKAKVKYMSTHFMVFIFITAVALYVNSRFISPAFIVSYEAMTVVLIVRRTSSLHKLMLLE